MSVPTDMVIELLTECADVRLKDPRAGLELVDDARHHCALVTDPDDALALRLRLDAAEAGCRMRTEPEVAHRIAETVVREAGSTTHLAHARAAALGVLGALLTRSDLGKSTEVLEKGLRVYEEAGVDDARLKATLLYGMGNAAYRDGDFRRAREHYTHAVGVAPAGSQIALFTLGMLGGVLSFLGDHEGAGQTYSQALAGHRRARSRIGIAGALHNLAANLHRLGKLADADRANAECLGILEGTDDGPPLDEPGQRVAALDMRAKIQLGRGQSSQALDSAARAAALADEQTDRQLQIVCRITLSECRLAAGDVDAGLRDAESALDRAARDGGAQLRGQAELAMARALCAVDRQSDMGVHLGRALTNARELDVPAQLTDTLREAAHLYESCGRFEEAMRCMREFHDAHTEAVRTAAESRLERLLLERDLKRAQERESELQSAGRELEAAVRRRTRELERANQRLRQQIEANQTLEEQRHAVEEQLLQAQKLEAIGGLAAGIAHDLNNVLTVILGYGSLIPSGEGAEHDPRMEAMLEAAKRASGMTRQLLLFSRQHPWSPRVVDVRDLLEGLRPILRRLVPASVALEYDFTGEAVRVEADPTQLEQVVLNLVANARDAVGDEGRILVQLERATDRATAVIHVADDGRGIDADVLARVMDPFFTTKAPGEGTGLGLSTAYGIVRRHSGDLRLNSSPGLGTRASIYLPCTESIPTAETATAANRVLRKRLVALLVEDDDGVRPVVAQMLESLGVTVLHATNGRVALEVLAERHHTIDVVVTDVVMPKMGGVELLQEAQRAWPHLKYVFVSGYSPELAQVPQSCRFLAKPLTVPQLREALTDLMAGGGA